MTRLVTEVYRPFVAGRHLRQDAFGRDKVEDFASLSLDVDFKGHRDVASIAVHGNWIAG
jgi:hypothetical protein